MFQFEFLEEGIDGINVSIDRKLSQNRSYKVAKIGNKEILSNDDTHINFFDELEDYLHNKDKNGNTKPFSLTITASAAEPFYVYPQNFRLKVWLHGLSRRSGLDYYTNKKLS